MYVKVKDGTHVVAVAVNVCESLLILALYLCVHTRTRVTPIFYFLLYPVPLKSPVKLTWSPLHATVHVTLVVLFVFIKANGEELGLQTVFE